jgi:hypothetical protein
MSENVDEMATFIYHEDGSMGAEEGCHDDRVIAPAIAATARKTWTIDRYYGKGA